VIGEGKKGTSTTLKRAKKNRKGNQTWIRGRGGQPKKVPPGKAKGKKGNLELVTTGGAITWRWRGDEKPSDGRGMVENVRRGRR